MAISIIAASNAAAPAIQHPQFLDLVQCEYEHRAPRVGTAEALRTALLIAIGDLSEASIIGAGRE